MNTEKSYSQKMPSPRFTAAERRHPARPWLLILLGILLVFGLFWLLLLCPLRRGGEPCADHAAGNGGLGGGGGSGTGLFGDGPGAGETGEGRGIDGSVPEGTGRGDQNGTGENQGASAKEQQGESAGKLPDPAASAETSVSRGESPPAAKRAEPQERTYRETVSSREIGEKAAKPAETTRHEMHGFSPGKENTAGGGSAGQSGRKGFYGVKVRGNTLFIVDVSSSMRESTSEGPSRIEILRNQLKNSILGEHRRGKKTKYSIIAFSSILTKFPARDGKVQTYFFNAVSIAEMKQFCDGLTAGGNTRMMMAWKDAVEMIRRKDVNIDTIFFLSDGEPNDCSMEELIDYIKENVDEKIVIHTIAIGMNSPGMERIAKEHHGTHRSIQ